MALEAGVCPLRTAAGAEELVYRGYLLTRLKDLSGSAPHAILLTAVLFGLVHVYQGGLGVIYSTIFGLIFGFSFLRLRRIWPLALADAFTDIVAFTW